MFACLLNYLPASLSILLLMVVKSLKSYLYYFSWKCMVLRYLCQFLVSVQFSCVPWHSFAWCACICYAVSCHLPDVTLMSCYHLAPDMLLLDTCFLLWHDLSLVTCLITCYCHVKTWYLLWLTFYSWLSHYGNVVSDLLLCTPIMLVMCSCYDQLCSYSFP